MTKYIDLKETKRLERLKTVKSSIGISSLTSHSGWQKSQIEKRRRDQVRQRKMKTAGKPLGDGIKVDMQVKREDAQTKCGLKLKMSTGKTVDKEKKNCPPCQPKPKPPVNRGPDRGCPPKNHPRLENTKAVPSAPAPAPTRKTPEAVVKRGLKWAKEQSKLQQKSDSGFRGSISHHTDGKGQAVGKENSPENDTTTVTRKQGTSTKKKDASASKHYSMDISSLRQEHAEAM